MAKIHYGGITLKDHSNLHAAKEWRFFDSDSSNYAAIKAPATIAADYTLTLPVDDGTSGQVLSTDGSGALSWVSSLTATLSSQNVLIGNGSNVATATDTTSTGDILANSATALTIKSGVISNSHINASAAIAYSKLNLAASIVNADIAVAAAIAYSKLSLTGSIVDADINATAAIDATKIANGSVSNTEFQYLDGVTSSIQTQFGGKASTALDNLASVAINTSLISDTDNTDDLGSSAITWKRAYLKTGLILQETGVGTDAITIAAPAALAASYSLVLPATDGNAGEVLKTDGSGNLDWVKYGYAATWANADGATKTITHNLGSKDVIVQIYDMSNDTSIEVDSVVRTDTNTVDLAASQAPGVNWRVLIQKV